MLNAARCSSGFAENAKYDVLVFVWDIVNVDTNDKMNFFASSKLAVLLPPDTSWIKPMSKLLSQPASNSTALHYHLFTTFELSYNGAE